MASRQESDDDIPYDLALTNYDTANLFLQVACCIDESGNVLLPDRHSLVRLVHAGTPKCVLSKSNKSSQTR
jgi:hypothetical protein